MSAGKQRLQVWLKSQGRGALSALARGLELNHTTIINWRDGDRARPNEFNRVRLDLLTAGAVPASSWLTDEERELLERLETPAA